MSPLFKRLIDTLTRPLPAGWRARLWQRLRRDEQAALVSDVDTCLLVLNERLYHLGDGSWCDIAASRPGLDAARQLAAAAARLLEGRPLSAGLALLLPPAGFAATRVALPGVAADAVRPALQLQADSLLPGINEPLALAVNPQRQQPDGAEVGLWMSHNRLSALGEAFAERNLPLLVVLPRQLLALAAGAEGQVEEADGQTRTCCQWQHGALTQWLQVAEADLAQPAFADQWQQSLAGLPAAGGARQQWSTLEHYLNFGQEQQPLALPAAYCFVPPIARQRHQRRHRQQLASRVSISLLLLLGLACLPWLWQSWQLWRLDTALSQQISLSGEARADQRAVRDFELRWALYEDFPRLDVAQLLFTLQGLVNPDVLTGLEIRDGELQLEGQSAEPQALLQRLAAHENFEQVRFLRATSNNRYAIALQLRSVDFDTYETWYFGAQR